MATSDEAIGVVGQIAHESLRLSIKMKRRTEHERLLGKVNTDSVNLPDPSFPDQ